MVTLAGCQTKPTKTATSSGAVEAEKTVELPELPFKPSGTAPKELDTDIVYSYLAGEIAAISGKLEDSIDHYLRAATLAQDPYAAKRATQIALHVGDAAAAQRAVRRWVELDPNSARARQMAIILFVRAGETEDAYQQMTALLEIGKATSIDGFALISGTLGKKDMAKKGLPLIKQLVINYPGNARALYAQAVVEVASGDLPAAEETLEQVISLDSQWEQPRILIASLMADSGRVDEAMESFQDSLKALPKKATSLRRTYARHLVQNERYEEAIDQFKLLQTQLPEDTDILYALGMLYIEIGDLKTARGYWQSLKDSGDKFHEASYFLAQVEEELGDIESAKENYKAVQKGKFRSDAWIRLAILYGETGQVKEARDLLSKLRLLDKKRAVDAYLTEAIIYQNLKDTKSALAVYEVALKEHPGDTDLLYNRALYAAEIDRIDWLERDLTIIIKKEPDNADALNALGYTLADKTDRYEEAFGYISHAYRLKPDSAAILDSMGWVYYRMGDYEQALHYLKQAHKLLADAEISAHLGEVLWQRGDHSAARSVWKKALDEYPESEILQSVMKRFQ